MKRLVYIVFSLCAIGFAGSLLLSEHVNLLVGLTGFVTTYFLGVYALENFDMTFKDTNETPE
jgi:hypothetical protein